jgi:hypothetical protein
MRYSLRSVLVPAGRLRQRFPARAELAFLFGDAAAFTTTNANPELLRLQVIFHADHTISRPAPSTVPNRLHRLDSSACHGRLLMVRATDRSRRGVRLHATPPRHETPRNASGHASCQPPRRDIHVFRVERSQRGANSCAGPRIFPASCRCVRKARSDTGRRLRITRRRETQRDLA